MSDNPTGLPPKLPAKMIAYTPFVPTHPPERAARDFYGVMRQRRSVRFFSNEPVSEETIRWIIAAAGTAPSGANKQPWRFVAVQAPELKQQIRAEAELEEREFYARRANPEWLADLAPLGTDPIKDYLEIAPWIIVVFRTMKADPDETGRRGQV